MYMDFIFCKNASEKRGKKTNRETGIPKKVKQYCELRHALLIKLAFSI
jgi:hypothetical protein